METKFYRVRLTPASLVDTKMVNGVKLTKNWQIRSGDAGKLTLFKDIEIVRLKKEKGKYFPIEDQKTVIPPQPVKAEPAPVSVSVDTSDISKWTEQQLKNFLIEKGSTNKELKSLSFEELIEKVNFINSQNNQDK